MCKVDSRYDSQLASYLLQTDNKYPTSSKQAYKVAITPNHWQVGSQLASQLAREHPDESDVLFCGVWSGIKTTCPPVT